MKDRYAKLRLGLMRKPIPVVRVIPVGVVPWPTRAMEWISTLPSGHEITSDILIAEVGMPNPEVDGPNKNNSVGSIFSVAAKKGLILNTGNRVKSLRPANRGAKIAVWERV